MPKLLTQGVSLEPKNGRQLIGIVAGFKSERWPVIDRNAGRLQLGIRKVSLIDVAYDPAQPVLGNPNGELSIVEFFDYACPTCKTLHPHLKQIVADDGHIRLVMKDWPINGEVVLYAARMVHAAGYLGHYASAHLAVMGIAGTLTHRSVDDGLRRSNINPADVRDALDLHLPRIDALLERNREQAKRLNLIGTPSFLIGSRLYGGPLSPDQIREAITLARQR